MRCLRNSGQSPPATAAFRAVLEGTLQRGLATDAQIAAHAIEHAGVVHSDDRDFGRFAGLRWRNPLG